MKFRNVFFAILIVFGAGCTIIFPPKPDHSIKDSETPREPIERELPTAIVEKQQQSGAKNIVLMIGDGMGLTQITAAMFRNGNHLNLEKFKILGLHKSYSSSHLITDSAAGATAFSAGVKTYNGAIGVNRDTVAVVTILEEARDRGMATGLISTSSIVHATPASFAAHVASRNMKEEIAEDLATSGVDFMVGGGKKYFDRRDKDDDELSVIMSGSGEYMVSDFVTMELEEVTPDPARGFLYLTSHEEPLPLLQGRSYLETAVDKALEYLPQRNEKGFFLMVEGSQIDWGGHANDINYVTSELLEFDRVVGNVLKWAEADGETLVIVTADHETGGLSIVDYGSTMDNYEVAWGTVGHTPDLIPVFAKGPGATSFGGIYENIAIYQKMRQAYLWGNSNSK